MYNSVKIITGLIIFLGLATYPFWEGLIHVGKAEQKPVINLGTTETQCVESAEYMRANHMQLLEDWRHSVVRSEERSYKSFSNGKVFDKSLTNTCLNCHTNKKEFCDSCHNYASVKPYCWECHIVPGDKI